MAEIKTEVKTKVIQVEQAICPYCNSVYNSRKDAEECASWYEKMEAISKCKPYRWYQVATTRYYCGDGETRRWVFLKSIKVDCKYCSNKIHTCKDLDFRLSEFGNTSYWSSDLRSEHVKFFPETALTIAEAYEKYGLLIEINQDNSDWKHTPQEIIDEYNAVLQKARNQKYEEICSLSVEQLIDIVYSDSDICKKYSLYTGETDNSGQSENTCSDDLCSLFGSMFPSKDERKDVPAQKLLEKSKDNKVELDDEDLDYLEIFDNESRKG